MVTIRKGDMFDHTALLLLLRSWFDESKIIQGYDEAASGWLSTLLTSPNSLIFIAEHDGKMIGSINVRQATMPWNGKAPFLIMDFIMTDKEHRGKGVAGMLINEIKKVADTYKMSLFMGHDSGTDVELKNRYFKMCGFECLGGNFIYNEGV